MTEEVKTDVSSDLITEDLTPNKDGGVIKVIKKAGVSDEKPSANNKVWVHYTGQLMDGTKFDSSVDRNEKFTFDLGKGQVIKAWDLGVASMKRGEVCVLTCSAEYAYGERGSPPAIPANATLCFEIELFDWEGEDISEGQNKGIIRSVIKEGDGYSQPNEDASVKIHLKGTYNDNVFDDREVKFIVGDVEDENLPIAINTMVKKMKLREISNFTVSPKYAFGEKGSSHFNIPGDGTVIYNIHMLEFEKAKEAWDMDDKEKIEQSVISKENGTELFKAAKYERAIKQYQKIDTFLVNKENEADDEINKKWDELKIAGKLNLALCYMKTGEFAEVIKSCSDVLEIEANNEKALFRRGEAYISMKYYAEAKTEFESVLSVNPKNKLASKKVVQCNNGIKALYEKEKKTFKGMFDKFARQDEIEQIKKKKLMQQARKNASGSTNGSNGEGKIEAKAEENGKNNEEIDIAEEPTVTA